MPVNFITGFAAGAVTATTAILTVQGIKKHLDKKAAEKAKAGTSAGHNTNTGTEQPTK